MDQTIPPDETTTRIDAGMRALCGIAAYYRIGADPTGLARELALNGREADEDDLVRGAKLLGLKARSVSGVDAVRLARLPIPAIVRARSGAILALGRDRSGQLLLIDPISQAVQAGTAAEIAVEISGRAVLVARKVGGAGIDPRTFSFRWFLPTVWRYRKPLRHVLAASLFLQIFALTTPLIFQVVVDKVLTHRSYETLYVLIGGLVVLGLFDVVLQYLRMYALSHTTNRIDVELGQRLFAHLLHLPMSYFETRAAGQTVARVRELETIRSFLTGQGLFSAIDLLFAFVFVAVLFAYSWRLTLIVLCSLPALHPDRLRHSPAVARSHQGEVQSGRSDAAVSRRNHRRSRHDQVGRGRAAHARAMGGEAGGLCKDELRRDHARLGRPALDPVCQQAHHRRRPAVRRRGGDRRRTDGWRADRLQHDRRAGGAADPAALPALAGFPAGPDLDRSSRRHSEPADRAGAADAPCAPDASRRDRTTVRQLPLLAGRPRGSQERIASHPAGRDHRHRRPVRLRQVDADQAGAAALHAERGAGLS